MSEDKLPRHPLAGPWLRANPTPGVEDIDRKDGLGPRLLGWPDDRPHPDFEAFATTYAATQKAETDQRTADQAVLERWDSATAAEKWAVVGRFLHKQGLG